MALYEKTSDRATAIQLLSGDVFSNLITLKMLTLYPDFCTSTAFLRCDDWTCLTELEVAASHWDRRAYPGWEHVVLLDGNSQDLLHIAFDHAPKVGSVYKVHDPFTQSLVSRLLGASRRRSFLSYSTMSDMDEPGSSIGAVREYVTLTSEAMLGFSHNGYSGEELAALFQCGASWFGLAVDGHCASQCLIFRNYGHIWEIGGVYTQPEHRHKGYARLVVQAAVRCLRSRDLVPRYQFESNNTASQALAESVGLRHFLTVEHYTTMKVPSM
jgi:GNAT superfamily N-acetyltransferase